MSPAKFSFYSPAAPPAVTKEVARPVEEDHTTVGVDASYSASTEEPAEHQPAAVLSDGAAVEAGVADAAQDGIPRVAADAATAPAAGTDAAHDGAGRGGEEVTTGEGEAAEEEAYKSCAEEDGGAEDEDDKREEHSVFKGDHKVVQAAHSCVSEVTYENAPVAAAASSTCSASAPAAEAALPADAVTLPADTVSGKLASMMLERIQAMDNIRVLLQQERQQEDGLRTEVAQDIRALEATLVTKEDDIADLRAKNDDYARQLGRLSSTINELVESNHDNIERMAELELDVAVKTNTITETSQDLDATRAARDAKADENAALLRQLELFRADNDGLRASNEELQTKNTDFANELENLMTSLQELIEQNTALEGQVEDLVGANKKLEDVLVPTKQKNEELLDVVEGLTASLNAANTHHKHEVDKLKKENEALKKQMAAMEVHARQEKEQLEQTIEDTTTQMTDKLSAQKVVCEKQVACLTTLLDDAKASCQKNRQRNDRLQQEIAAIGAKSAQSAASASATIGQLEKDLEEEFEITTQLKRGLDDLKKLAQDDERGADKYADEAEDLLSLLRMIQCWQLSHFQRINKLVSDNKEHVRSVQTLS